MQETSFSGKPDSRSYKAVENLYPNVKQIVFCDDSLTNLDAARQLGWTTVLYKADGTHVSTIHDHIKINSLEELINLV
jgi:FMN phosphatase YigB (HAD superfamily)